MRSISFTRFRVLVAVALVLTPVLLLAAGAGSDSGTSAAAGRPARLPARVFAPYFETWTTNRLIRVAERSGVRNFTLAFIQATEEGVVHAHLERRAGPDDGSRPLPAGTAGAAPPGRRRRAVVRRLQRRPCAHRDRRLVHEHAQAGRGLRVGRSRTYGATRLDMDVEDRSLDNRAGIDRRNKALRQVEAWAAPHRSPAPDLLHAARRAPGLEAGRPPRAAKRDQERHPGGRRQHHDLRLLRRRDDRHGRSRDRAPPAAYTASCTRSTPAAAPAGSGRWRATPSCRASTTIRARPRSRRSPMPAACFGSRAQSASAPSRCGRSSATTATARAAIGSNDCSGIVQPDWAFSHLLEPFTQR